MLQFPVPLGSFVAHQWLCDHFGHLNARHYASAFDDAIFIFWSHAGVVPPRPGQPGVIPVTARLTIDYRSEVTAGQILHVSGQPVRVGGKSVTLALTLRDGATGGIVATCEVVEVFFDALARESAAIPDHVRDSLQGAQDPAGPGR